MAPTSQQLDCLTIEIPIPRNNGGNWPISWSNQDIYPKLETTKHQSTTRKSTSCCRKWKVDQWQQFEEKEARSPPSNLRPLFTPCRLGRLPSTRFRTNCSCSCLFKWTSSRPVRSSRGVDDSARHASICTISNNGAAAIKPVRRRSAVRLAVHACLVQLEAEPRGVDPDRQW
jgi:hypothetical protein